MQSRLFTKPLVSLGLAVILGTTALVAPAGAETLKVAWSQDATGLDPHKQTAFSSIRFLELMYEPLVRLDAEAEIVPAVAASWGVQRYRYRTEYEPQSGCHIS